MTTRSRATRVATVLADHPVVIGFGARIFLAWLLPWILDDGRFIPGVAYTDIDFTIFTDAAAYIREGKSPFDRHTYRYTPFLAAIISYLPKEGSRYLFCVADGICGWIILWYRRSAREKHGQQTPVRDMWPRLQDAIWWMYNPLAINICTRGSSESLMVLLPVLCTVRLVNATARPSWRHALAAGICHGIAVHSKLYPIIYSLSYMAYFGLKSEMNQSQKKKAQAKAKVTAFPWTIPRKLSSLIGLWVSRLLTMNPIIFFGSFVFTFSAITYLGVRWYGNAALDEGLLYHFSRVDHRHNYSIYWYWIYLAKARLDSNMALIGRILLLPQLVLLVYSSIGIAPQHLTLALFVQTYLFVLQNKVITAQYFTWYLCLLPLCSDEFVLTKRVKIALAGLGLSIAFWLGSAYCLEMQGMAVHTIVFSASVFHFCANVNLLVALLASHAGKRKTKEDKSKTS